MSTQYVKLYFLCAFQISKAAFLFNMNSANVKNIYHGYFKNME